MRCLKRLYENLGAIVRVNRLKKMKSFTGGILCVGAFNVAYTACICLSCDVYSYAHFRCTD